MRSKVHQSRHLLLSTLVLVCLGWVFYISYFRHSKHLVDSIESADPDKSDGMKHKSKYKKILSNEGDLLDNEQLSRLNDITSGLLTRKNVEVIISRHNEDISWSDMYASIRTVYEKSDEPNVLKGGAPDNVVRLAILGRESHTYLTHIVNNYGTLAELTVFSQGSAPTHKIHRKANSTLHDFVLNEKGHFIFTGAIWLPTMAHILRTEPAYDEANANGTDNQCPFPRLTEPGGSEYKFDLDDKNHIHILRHIASLCTAEASTTCSGYSFWKTFIKLPLPKDHVMFFSQGAIVSATAEQIRKRPLKDYQRLLAEVSKSDDTAAGFFLEWMWYYVVTSDVSPCPVNGHEFDWALTRKRYKQMEFPKRLEYAEERGIEVSTRS